MFKKSLSTQGHIRKYVCGHGCRTGQRSYGHPAFCAGLSGHFAIGYWRFC